MRNLMRYSALEISRYVLTHCYEIGKPVSNLKLQKLLYFVQGEFYKVKGLPLFNDDFVARKVGPIVPEVYYEYGVYGGTTLVNTYETNIKNPDKAIIDTVINKYIDVPVWKLIEMTHGKGTPWVLAYEEREEKIIPQSLFAEYFTNSSREQ